MKLQRNAFFFGCYENTTKHDFLRTLESFISLYLSNIFFFWVIPKCIFLVYCLSIVLYPTNFSFSKFYSFTKIHKHSKWSHSTISLSNGLLLPFFSFLNFVYDAISKQLAWVIEIIAKLLISSCQLKTFIPIEQFRNSWNYEKNQYFLLKWTKMT